MLDVSSETFGISISVCLAQQLPPCLGVILKNGECWLLGQGLNEVFVRVFKARAGKFRQLKAALTAIPAAWPQSTYETAGYNFITDAEGPNANEIAVFGKQPGQKIGQYYVPPAGSPVEGLVKAIANID